MNLRIRLPNNEEIQAPVEEWLAALIAESSPRVQARIFQRIRAKTVFYRTPGSYILQAEGGFLSNPWK